MISAFFKFSKPSLIRVNLFGAKKPPPGGILIRNFQKKKFLTESFSVKVKASSLHHCKQKSKKDSTTNFFLRNFS